MSLSVNYNMDGMVYVRMSMLVSPITIIMQLRVTPEESVGYVWHFREFLVH